jgi:hypothetical protein
MGSARGRRVAAACDSALDFIVLAYAAWTLIYTACLVLRVPAGWAAAAEAAALFPCAWFVRGRAVAPAVSPPASAPPPRPWLRACSLTAALAAATIAALAARAWTAVWVLWLVALGSALAWLDARPRPRALPRDGADGSAGAAVAWAAALGLLALALVDPDADDTHYVHQSAWVADRGRFPVRDTLFSDERFDAIFFPPWSSIEALAGTAAHVTGFPAHSVVYVGLAPLAAVLSVLALWRLLRTWAVPLPALALSTSLIFLLATATADHHTVGRFFVGRIWQGKAMFVAIMVPLLLALLDGYVERPARRRLVLLAAGGVAAVGLTSTSLVVVPAIAIGALALPALRAPRAAAGALAALLAYPALALVVSLATGMRNPDLDQGDPAAGELAREALGAGMPAFVTVGAVLAAPTLLRRGSAPQTAAAVALIAGALLTPGVPALVGAVTGFGESLWRVLWAVPIAALVGATATSIAPGRRLAAAALCAALAAWALHAGPPPGTRLAATPALKRPPADLIDARAILARAHHGDLVLAPQGVSATLLVISARPTTVDPRDFYTLSLGRVPGQWRVARPRLRVRLQVLADPQLARRRGGPPSRDFVARALRILGVDIACVRRGQPPAVPSLRAAGFGRRFTTPRLACLRHPFD